MARVRPTEDVRPLSEFRANAASFVQQVQGTKRPVILTVHGRSAAVLLDVGEYETLLDQLELLRDVKAAEGQLKQGRTVSQAKAREKVLARFRK
jgi:antitoxin YefM